MFWRPLIPLMLLVVLGLNVSADTGSTNSIERYKIIMEKSPFKRFSDPVSIASGPTSGSLTLQGFFADGKEKKVWLRDSSQNNKTSCVGETESVNGYRVDKIDTENQSVTLTHGVETISLKFPEKNPTAPSPMAAAPAGLGRPVYRNPRVAVPPPSLQAPVAPPPPTGTAPMPLATIVPTPNTNTNDQRTSSPTSLRRRILRQNVRAVQPSADAPAEKEEKAAKEEQAEQAAEAAPAAQ